MTDFIVTITDPTMLDGITWAREQHNASIPPPPPEPMMAPDDPDADAMAEPAPPPPPEPIQMTLDTDEAYVQWVMEQASISYADQKLRLEHQQNYENASKTARTSMKV